MFLRINTTNALVVTQSKDRKTVFVLQSTFVAIIKLCKKLNVMRYF